MTPLFTLANGALFMQKNRFSVRVSSRSGISATSFKDKR